MDGRTDQQAGRWMVGWRDRKKEVWEYMTKTCGNKEEGGRGKCMNKKG